MDRDQSEQLLKVLMRLEENTRAIPVQLEDMVDLLETFLRVYQEETRKGGDVAHI